MERLHYGWQDNAAGMRFSSYYGFGVVDAGELVKAAAKCDDDPMCVEMGKPAEADLKTRSVKITLYVPLTGSRTKMIKKNYWERIRLPLTRLRLNFPGLPMMPVIRYTINARS